MENQLKKNQPIAVFDSGVGGISVLRELVKLMPNEDYIYFGDSLHAPYGTKSLEEVQKLTCDHAKRLFEDGAKGLVVACNTATSAAVKKLRELYPTTPIVGIEPAVKPASTFMEHPTVLVLATPMTIRNEKLQKLMSRYEKAAKLIPVSCPGLMDFVERGDLHSEELHKYLTELLYEFREEKIHAVVLGCTHYPFVSQEIKEILGDEVTIFDGGAGTAREMKRRLAAEQLLTERQEKGKVIFTNSKDSQEKQKLCHFLMEQSNF